MDPREDDSSTSPVQQVLTPAAEESSTKEEDGSSTSPVQQLLAPAAEVSSTKKKDELSTSSAVQQKFAPSAERLSRKKQPKGDRSSSSSPMPQNLAHAAEGLPTRKLPRETGSSTSSPVLENLASAGVGVPTKRRRRRRRRRLPPRQSSLSSTEDLSQIEQKEGNLSNEPYQASADKERSSTNRKRYVSSTSDSDWSDDEFTAAELRKLLPISRPSRKTIRPLPHVFTDDISYTAGSDNGSYFKIDINANESNKHVQGAGGRKYYQRSMPEEVALDLYKMFGSGINTQKGPSNAVDKSVQTCDLKAFIEPSKENYKDTSEAYSLPSKVFQEYPDVQHSIVPSSVIADNHFIEIEMSYNLAYDSKENVKIREELMVELQNNFANIVSGLKLNSKNELLDPFKAENYNLKRMFVYYCLKNREIQAIALYRHVIRCHCAISHLTENFKLLSAITTPTKGECMHHIILWSLELQETERFLISMENYHEQLLFGIENGDFITIPEPPVFVRNYEEPRYILEENYSTMASQMGRIEKQYEEMKEFQINYYKWWYEGRSSCGTAFPYAGVHETFVALPLWQPHCFFATNELSMPPIMHPFGAPAGFPIIPVAQVPATHQLDAVITGEPANLPNNQHEVIPNIAPSIIDTTENAQCDETATDDNLLDRQDYATAMGSSSDDSEGGAFYAKTGDGNAAIKAKEYDSVKSFFQAFKSANKENDSTNNRHKNTDASLYNDEVDSLNLEKLTLSAIGIEYETGASGCISEAAAEIDNDSFLKAPGTSEGGHINANSGGLVSLQQSHPSSYDFETKLKNIQSIWLTPNNPEDNTSIRNVTNNGYEGQLGFNELPKTKNEGASQLAATNYSNSTSVICGLGDENNIWSSLNTGQQGQVELSHSVTNDEAGSVQVEFNIPLYRFVPTGVIPNVILNERMNWNGIENAFYCILCVRSFDELPTTILKCLHKFHKLCIKNFLVINTSCPVCGSYIV